MAKDKTVKTTTSLPEITNPNSRETILKLSKTMSYETLVESIAKCNKSITGYQEEINALVAKRQAEEKEKNRLNSILLMKKRTAGA